MGYKMSTGKSVKIVLLCDRKRCEYCSYPECKHTSDISHAKNKSLIINDDVLLDENKFEKIADTYFEKVYPGSKKSA